MCLTEDLQSMLKAKNQRIHDLEQRLEELEQGLQLTRMSVDLIMARQGCSLELDREAKQDTLRTIDETLSDPTQQETDAQGVPWDKRTHLPPRQEGNR